MPDKCKYCKAPMQRLRLRDGHLGSPYRRFGWYHYDCGMRWHPEHGWTGRWQAPYCQLRTEKAKTKKLNAEVRRLRRLVDGKDLNA